MKQQNHQNMTICQHADFHRFLFTESSVKKKNGSGTSFQATFLVEFFDKKFSCAILHKLATFHCQGVFPFHVTR